LKKANQGMFMDISDVEKLFADNKLAQTLLERLKNADKDTFVPAMLSWLYFGQSFERMIEIGEELRKSPNAGYLQKFAIASTIKILISKSISLGLRTKADWEEHRRLMQMVDSDKVMDWAIEPESLTNETTIEPKSVKSNASTIEDMILIDGEKKQILLTKIEDYVLKGTKGMKIAHMILALRQLGYLPKITSDRHLFEALRAKYGDIGSDKSIYVYLSPIKISQFQNEIDTLSNYFSLD
jgi:hypothetical protein